MVRPEVVNSNTVTSEAGQGANLSDDRPHHDAALTYRTPSGSMYWSEVEALADSPWAERHAGRVQLILTSPPFPLNRKKSYGNLTGDAYKAWITDVFRSLTPLLTDNGSIIVELGNSWVSRSPEMSTLPLETLLEIKEKADLKLCQQFIIHNPARLPSPVQWVNIERIRVKDSYTNVWWLSPSERPKADNRAVLTEYSDSMKRLLKRSSYNDGKRPSGHNIGSESFNRDHGGAIPPNVLIASNTATSTEYRERCDSLGVPIHPARMQKEAVEFFVRLLTEPGDLVLDPFAGSNTTGSVCEDLGRCWSAIEADLDFIRGSTGRFGIVSWELESATLADGSVPTS